MKHQEGKTSKETEEKERDEGVKKRMESGRKKQGADPKPSHPGPFAAHRAKI